MVDQTSCTANPIIRCHLAQVISLVPPEARPRILDELDAGCIRALWKHSVSRYVLDDDRSAEIYSEHSVWDDLPALPGQVRETQH